MDLDTSLKVYLTDLEWLIILAILREDCTNLRFWTRFRVCEMGKFIHTIRSLDFFVCSPFFVAAIHQNERRLVSEEELINGPTSGTSVICKNVEKLRQWLNNYLRLYSNDILISEETSCDFTHSLKNTLKLLKQYENFNSKHVVIRKNTTSNENQRIFITNEMHLFEDLFILYLREYITFLPLGYVQKLPERPHSISGRATLDIDNVKHPVRRIEFNIPIRLNISVSEMALNLFPNEKLFREEYKTIDINTQEISQKLKEINTQTHADSQSSEAKVIKTVTLHKINYETDFLPYKDALVLLYLAIGNKYLITEAGMKDSLPAISKMPFLTVRDGGRKHIEKALKKYAQPIKTYELALPDKTCCIIVTDSVEFNKYIQDYVTKYLNEQLENPNNYYQYGISWNMTVRWLNSLQIIHGNVYSLSPEVIKNNQDILINKASWIECLLKLILDKRISLSEMTLDITKLPIFKVRIQQSEQLPFQESDDLEYLGIIINKNNEVWYKDKKVPLDFRSRQFIFLKYLVQLGDNYKKVTNPIEEFKNYLDKELKERGHKEPKRPTVRGIQDYASQIRIKFEKTVGTNAVTFHIVAGQTVLCLQNTSSTSREKRNEGCI